MEELPGLHAVLKATATELGELAASTDDLGGAQTVSAEQWQRLDLISQRLSCLSLFLQALVPEIPDCRPELHVALAAIKVGGLVSRLLGGAEEASDAGELELFKI